MYNNLVSNRRKSNFNHDSRLNLSGAGIIITGGTTGIGCAVAMLLAQRGANLLISGHNEEHLKDTLHDLEHLQPTGNVSCINVDLATEQGIKDLFSAADERMGNLDVIINNAALAHQGVDDGNYPDWERVVKTNLLSYIACTRYALDRMKPNNKGHIVYIGSMSADVREKGSSVYVATKSGVQGFAADGVKVTLIEPGATSTDMQPVDTDGQQKNVEQLEMLQARDVAEAVLYAIGQPMRCDVVDLKLRPHLQII
jgi:NADP-dependent 3-hydroxy acid dehydrogenase YdfG